MGVGNCSCLSSAFTAAVLFWYHTACVKRRDNISKFKRRRKGELTEGAEPRGSSLPRPLSPRATETPFRAVRRGGAAHAAPDSELGNRSPTPLSPERLSLLLPCSLRAAAASAVRNTGLRVAPEVCLKSAGSSVVWGKGPSRVMRCVVVTLCVLLSGVTPGPAAKPAVRQQRRGATPAPAATWQHTAIPPALIAR